MKYSTLLTFSAILMTSLAVTAPQTCLANSSGAPPTTLGVNGHPLSHSVYLPGDYTAVFKLMKAKGLKTYRFDVPLAADTDANIGPAFRSLLSAAKAQGIQLEPGLEVPFTWGDRTDNGQYPAGDSAALYSQGYNRVIKFVSQFAAEVNTWELQNETNLRNLDADGNRLAGRGWTAAEFDTPVMRDWASVLKGMSDAFDAINTSQGLHLRRIVGTTSSMFGFIEFMAGQGVKIDVLGYHYYEHAGVNPHNYWRVNASGFDLFNKLASYHRPVHVNEFNCAEIYDKTFVNTLNSPSMQTCDSNLNTMFKTFISQNSANIESILAYELLDEPKKPGAEGSFGLMFDLNTPKPSLNIIASYAALAAPAPVAQPAASSVIASINFPSQISLRNKVASLIKPIVRNAPADLSCVAILLPPGLSIDPSSCVISGAPAFNLSLSATGMVQTTTVISNALQRVMILNIEIHP